MNLKKSLLMAVFAAVSLCYATPIVLIRDNFTQKTNKWAKVSCYPPFSFITYTEKGVVLSRNEKQSPIKGRLFDTAFSFKSQKLTLPANSQWYEVKAAVTSTKGSLIPGGIGDDYWNRIVWFDKADRQMKGKESYYTPLFRKNLPYISQHKGVIPAGAVSAVLEFGIDTPDLLKNENFVLSGLQLTVGTEKEIKALPDETTTLHVPVLVSPSPVKDPAAVIIFEINGAKSADLKTIRFYWDDKEITPAVIRKGVRFSWKPVIPITKGVHFLTAEVRDLKESVAIKADAVVYYGDKNSKNIMTLRDDGMPMMNGKPFFVLGIACLVKQGRNGNSYERAFKEASEAGMNFARHWSTYNANSRDAKEYLAAAKKYNMYISASPSLVKNDTNVRRVAHGVASQINVDRIIAWDIGDDTSSWISPGDLLAKHRALKAVDPTRITTQADPIIWGKTTASRYAAYVNASDNFQPEIYPIGNNNCQKETLEMTARMVPVVIRDMKKVLSDQKQNRKEPKSIWPLIQYFHYKPTHRYWDRMPSAAELRAMSYLAVIHGAHGIIWYRYAGYRQTVSAKRGYSDEQWNILTKLSREMRGMYDILCERTGKQIQTVKLLLGPAKDGLGYDSVNTLLKEYKGTKYLFVCNSALKPLKASFSITGAKSVKDRLEKTFVSVKNGTFTASFEPYGVKVFEIK